MQSNLAPGSNSTESIHTSPPFSIHGNLSAALTEKHYFEKSSPKWCIMCQVGQ